VKWIKVSKKENFFARLSLLIEMEENAKEVEHDLRQNIDLLQNQLREVCRFFFSIKKFSSKSLARTTNGTITIYHR